MPEEMKTDKESSESFRDLDIVTQNTSTIELDGQAMCSGQQSS